MLPTGGSTTSWHEALRELSRDASALSATVDVPMFAEALSIGLLDRGLVAELGDCAHQVQDDCRIALRLRDAVSWDPLPGRASVGCRMDPTEVADALQRGLAEATARIDAYAPSLDEPLFERSAVVAASVLGHDLASAMTWLDVPPPAMEIRLLQIVAGGPPVAEIEYREVPGVRTSGGRSIKGARMVRTAGRVTAWMSGPGYSWADNVLETRGPVLSAEPVCLWPGRQLEELVPIRAFLGSGLVVDDVRMSRHRNPRLRIRVVSDAMSLRDAIPLIERLQAGIRDHRRGVTPLIRV